jgi:replicative DNA helicase
VDLDLLFLKRTPPHSLEAERTVLGGILVNPSNFSVALSTLAIEDFYKDAHRTILESIGRLVDKGVTVDLVAVGEELRREGALDAIGGAAYLSSLMDGVARNSNIRYYASIIKDKALLRRLIFSSAQIINASYEDKEDVDDLINAAQAAMIDVAEKQNRKDFLPLSEIVGPTMAEIERQIAARDAVTGLDTGFFALNEITAGFHPAELVIVAARPSMGKTAICLNMTQHMGQRNGKAVGFFSMEMSKEALLTRMLCSDAMIDLQHIRKGLLNDRDMDRLRLSAETLAPCSIFLDETPALTLAEMKAKARRLKLEGNLDIVFIDYIQLMQAGGRFENRNQEMSFITRSLKELAKELHIPVVGISQLSRAPEKSRREPRPMLSDLRESGAIEQDADVVIFIFRPERYLSPEERETHTELRGIGEVIVAKQRNGPVGELKLAFQDRYAKFENLERTRTGPED